MSASLPTAGPAVPASTVVAENLLVALRRVPDPRRGGARRHPLDYVLAVLAAAFACAGFESFTAAAQWAAQADPALLLSLGAAPDPLTGAVVAPSEATIRRLAGRLDVQALEAEMAVWAAGQLTAPGADERVAVAVDGKTVRGARTPGQPAPHLLSAATHDQAIVLAQRQIPGKTNEIPQVTLLLDDLKAAGHDPATMIFTLDALHTQHATARLLQQAGAGYVLTVKGNQPRLRTAIIEALRTPQQQDLLQTL